MLRPSHGMFVVDGTPSIGRPQLLLQPDYSQVEMSGVRGSMYRRRTERMNKRLSQIGRVLLHDSPIDKPSKRPFDPLGNRYRLTDFLKRLSGTYPRMIDEDFDLVVGTANEIVTRHESEPKSRISRAKARFIARPILHHAKPKEVNRAADAAREEVNRAADAARAVVRNIRKDLMPLTDMMFIQKDGTVCEYRKQTEDGPNELVNIRHYRENDLGAGAWWASTRGMTAEDAETAKKMVDVADAMEYVAVMKMVKDGPYAAEQPIVDETKAFGVRYLRGESVLGIIFEENEATETEEYQVPQLITYVDTAALNAIHAGLPGHYQDNRSLACAV
jgi:hypothetical protein